MAVYRQVHISFWQDPDVLDYTPEEKYFYLYLMTNSKTSQCGIYELPKKIIELETGYNRETVEKLLERFTTYKKILYNEPTKEIMILNWMKHNAINSGTVKACILKELKGVKNKAFVQKFLEVCIRYGYGINTVSIDLGEEKEKEEEEEQEPEKEITTKTVEDAIPTTSNPTSVDDPDSPKSEYHQPASLLPTSQHMSTVTTLEPETEEKIPYKAIIDYLNQRTEKAYKHTSQATQRHIQARWNDGFRLADFQRVIDNKARSWLHDQERNKFLRPETLFGPKFEGYLNERRQVGKTNLAALGHPSASVIEAFLAEGDDEID